MLPIIIENGGDHWIFSIETDSVSAGLQSDAPVGWLIKGLIEESAEQIFKKKFDVEQVACRAPASVWHVPKKPTKD